MLGYSKNKSLIIRNGKGSIISPCSKGIYQPSMGLTVRHDKTWKEKKKFEEPFHFKKLNMPALNDTMNWMLGYYHFYKSV